MNHAAIRIRVHEAGDGTALSADDRVLDAEQVDRSELLSTLLQNTQGSCDLALSSSQFQSWITFVPDPTDGQGALEAQPSEHALPKVIQVCAHHQRGSAAPSQSFKLDAITCLMYLLV